MPSLVFLCVHCAKRQFVYFGIDQTQNKFSKLFKKTPTKTLAKKCWPHTAYLLDWCRVSMFKLLMNYLEGRQKYYLEVMGADDLSSPGAQKPKSSSSSSDKNTRCLPFNLFYFSHLLWTLSSYDNINFYYTCIACLLATSALFWYFMSKNIYKL